VSRAGANSQSPGGGGAWRVPVLAAFIVFMIVPVIATALFSVAIRWDRTIWPEGLTLAWWVKVTGRYAFRDTLTNSLVVSAATVVLTAVLVTPAVYWTHTRLPRMKPWLEFLSLVPFALPGVVLALGLVRFYSRIPLPIINTPTILVAAYGVLTLPFMHRAVANAMESIDARTLGEAAQSLGADPRRTFLRVIVPNIVPGIVNGGLLAFSVAFAEFTLANLLVGTRFKTFPIYLVEFTRFDARQASALALMSFAIAWLISIAILWAAARTHGPRTTGIAR
jgi:putative spermidine/putrescine transport system permease protein